MLEDVDIVLNKNLLPWDSSKNSQDPSGLRIGTQEVTRIGFEKSEMKEIAKLMGDLLIRKRDSAAVRSDVRELKGRHQMIKFCFGQEKAYTYHEIFR